MKNVFPDRFPKPIYELSFLTQQEGPSKRPDGDVGQDQQRAAVLHFFTAGSDGLSRRHRECGSLLVLAELKRGEALKK